MATSGIQPERIRRLNKRPARDGGYVLYWMQQSQRAEWNHALEYAVGRANELKRPLLVCFGLTDSFPEANLRHYRFMLEGLSETARMLARHRIGFVLRRGDPAEVALKLAKDACAVVCDRGYLRIQRTWRKEVAERAKVEVVQVESDAVVPADDASRKAEYAARTIRPKITRLLPKYLVPLRRTEIEKNSTGLDVEGESMEDIDDLLGRLDLDRTVPPVSTYHGGAFAALHVLYRFVGEHLKNYVINRNRPETDDVSHMAMYLHFGQISPLEIALSVRNSDAPEPVKESFLEELIVRRELAINHVLCTANYDKYACLPAWAKASLRKHRRDRREYKYTLSQLENAETHDPYWNAAMLEMRHTGYMHNYMRMYWGKKIIEWSNTPEHAFRVALRLNNKYFLDGRDPSGFANVGWLFGLHDRPWAERPIFGMVRYMNAAGLERKSEPQAYVQKVKGIVGAAGRGNS
jgi:deoxyribodipyrimidine photo-lyase